MSKAIDYVKYNRLNELRQHILSNPNDVHSKNEVIIQLIISFDDTIINDNICYLRNDSNDNINISISISISIIIIIIITNIIITILFLIF